MSPVVKYDVSGVEASGASTPVKPGLYTAKIKRMTYRESNNDFQIVLTMTSGKSSGVDIFTWVNLGEASAWKLREFTDALGLKPKGGIDPDKMAGKTLAVNTNRYEYEGEMRNGIKSFLPSSALEDVEPEDDDEDEEPEDIDEDEGEEDEEDEDEEDEDEDEEDEDDRPNFDQLDRSALKAYIKENTLDIKVTKSMSDGAIRDAIGVALDGDEEEEDEEDFESMDDDELREEAESRGLKSTGSRKLLLKRLNEDVASNSSAPF